MKVRILDNFRM